MWLAASASHAGQLPPDSVWISPPAPRLADGLVPYSTSSRNHSLLAFSRVRPFGLSQHLLWPLLTSAWASRHLPMPIAQSIHADLPGYHAPTFTLIPVGSASQHSVQVSVFDDNGRVTPPW